MSYYITVLFGLLDPKYLFSVFSIFFYKRSYLNHHHYGTTIKVWAGEKWVGLLINTQAAEQMWDWLEITVCLIKGSDWLFRSRVICAYACKILDGYWSNLYRGTAWFHHSHLIKVPGDVELYHGGPLFLTKQSFIILLQYQYFFPKQL